MRNVYKMGDFRAMGRQLTVVTQQDGGGTDALLLGELDDGLGAHHGPARAAKGAVRHDVNALFPAQVDDLLLRETGVVLDLVHGGDDLGVGEQLLQVLLAVLRVPGCSVFVFLIRTPVSRVFSFGVIRGCGEKPTLQTPMALALPEAKTSSICFHAST